MKGISMEEKQKIKRERKKILVKIIEDHVVYKHAEIQKIFKEDYDLAVSQGTISRYAEELGIQKAKKGHYILGQKVALTKEANKFLRIWNSAEGRIEEGDWMAVMLKMNPTHVEIVVEQMVKLFAHENVDIHVFPGLNGSVRVFFDKEHRKVVGGILKKIENYNKQT